MIEITDRLSIPEQEITFVASRSGGPGGQHVNKVNTRVMLLFDVANSNSLTDEQKRLILKRLSGRINKQGILQVVSQQSRSQLANREAALVRFVELIRKALRRRTPRKRTRVPSTAKERRLREKKLRSRLKRHREPPGVGEF